MRTDIILVSLPPGWQRTLPIGLGFLASYLNKNGLSSVIYDMSVDLIDKTEEDDRKYLWGLKAKNIWLNQEVFRLFIDKYDRQIEACADYIASFEPMAVGLSVIHSKQLIALEVARRIKKKDKSIVIVMGGPACFYAEDRYMLEESGLIDVFGLGEGEETLLQVLRSIKSGSSLKEVKGIRTVSSGYKQYIPQAVIEDLDTIPFPEYPGLKLEGYSLNPVPLFWSRGCLGNCSFCEIKNVWPFYRMRSAENIFEELKWYVEEKGISHFSVFDSIVNGKPDVLNRVCEFIVQSGYKIHWEANVLSLPQMSQKIYSKMKEAGCKVAYFGLESGSDQILKRMRKSFTVREAERNIRLAHDVGIEVSVNFITGFPGEDEGHFEKTVDFAKNNHRWIDRADFITECQVARGTHLFLYPDDYGIVIPKDWEGYKWYSADRTNTLSLRQERTIRLGKVLQSLGIKIIADFNLDDGSQDVMDRIKSSLTDGLSQSIDHKDQKVIAEYNQQEKRWLPVPFSGLVPCVYFYGDSPESHKWGAGLNDADFDKQIVLLKELVKKKDIYHVVLGIGRQNFYQLDKLYNLIRNTRGLKNGSLNPFSIKPLESIRERFKPYLDKIRKEVSCEGIEFRIVEAGFDGFMSAIAATSKYAKKVYSNK